MASRGRHRQRLHLERPRGDRPAGRIRDSIRVVDRSGTVERGCVHLHSAAPLLPRKPPCPLGHRRSASGAATGPCRACATPVRRHLRGVCCLPSGGQPLIRDAFQHLGSRVSVGRLRPDRVGRPKPSLNRGISPSAASAVQRLTVARCADSPKGGVDTREPRVELPGSTRFWAGLRPLAASHSSRRRSACRASTLEDRQPIVERGF